MNVAEAFEGIYRNNTLATYWTCRPDHINCMTQLEDIFEELGLTQYLHNFLEQGFDTWESILDIRESDFNALGVKLGHRRKLERKIAASRGISNTQALPPLKAASPPAEEARLAEEAKLETSKVATPKSDTKGGGSNPQPTGKRKYRRHARPDENAPERPPSAYVIFSNKMREDLKGRSLSFTEIAKLVGENWQTLAPAEKEPYEQQAFAAKEKYAAKLAEYRQTENYRIYAEYLADFKAKQQYQLENSQDANNEGSKRPKLENLASQNSSNSKSSSSTGHDSRETSTGARTRIQSIGTAQTPWYAADQNGHTLPMHPASGAPSGPMHGHRESAATHSTGPATWRQDTRPIELPIHGGYSRQQERKSTQPSIYSGLEAAATYRQDYFRDQRPIGYTPPPLTHQSTDSTVKSSVSSASGDSRSQSSYYHPRTPLDVCRDRPSLPIPPIYTGSSLPGTFESQLPPIRHASLSPSTSINVSYNSPSNIMAIDHPPGRDRNIFYQNHMSPNTQQPHPLQRNMSAEDDNTQLDPVSALLRAGEIVSNQNRHEQQLQQQQTQQYPHQHHQPPK